MHYKYTSFFESSCVTVQYMSHSSRTKDHGTVLSGNLYYGHRSIFQPSTISSVVYAFLLPGNQICQMKALCQNDL